MDRPDCRFTAGTIAITEGLGIRKDWKIPEY